MPEAFDPYYKWLAIAPEDQPPDCYRLLGVRTFEDDPDVIENASDQRMAHLRTFQSGKHSEESQNLLNEVAAAKILLLNPEKKAKYDETLREQMRIRAEGGDDEEISSQLTGFLRAVELDDQFAAKPAGRTLPKATPLDPSKRTAKAAKAAGPSKKPIFIAAGVGIAILLLVILGVWATRSGDDDKPTVASEEQGDKAPLPPPPPSVPSEPSPEPAAKPAESAPENRTLENLMNEDKPDEVVQVGPTEPAGPSVEPPVSSPAAPSESVQQRLPVPSAAEQAKIAALIDSTYDPDDITKPSENLELAGRLLELAKKPGDNLTERFVLLRKTTELAKDAGDAGLMLSAVNVMAQQFEIAPLNVKGKLLLQFAEDARDKAAIGSLAENIGGPINEALAAGRPDAAYAIIDAAYTAAMRVRATEDRKALHDQREAVSKLYQPWLRNRQALAALEKNPDHPEANLAAGRYACFTEGKWDEGLPMLAKGSDPALQAVAKQELANPSDALSQVALADAWWAAAESESDDIQPVLKRHSGDWYQQALPAITSVVVKDKCTQRLAEVAKLAPEAPAVATHTAPSLPPQSAATPRGEAPDLAAAPFDARRAKGHQLAWARYLKLPPELSLDLGNGVKMQFVLIPPGEFMMGSLEPERQLAIQQAKAHRDKWAVEMIAFEGPQHRVKITKPFYLGKYEVTQAQWQAVMGNNPSRFKDPRNPVEKVSWNDIQPFLAKLSAAFEPKGIVFDLPTEAQWEYACRAGTTTAHCFGENPATLAQYGWFKSNAGGTTHPVGQGKPNAWGLYDIYGNVWEWCSDWHAPDYYAGSRAADPVGPPAGRVRVTRGGVWAYNAERCRSAFRGSCLPGERFDHNGFRLMCTVPSTNKPSPAPTRVLEDEKDLAIDLGNGVKMEFVLIPAGQFVMGSSDAERGLAMGQAKAHNNKWAIDRIPSEGPQHRIRSSKPFYLGKYEVTQAQWEAVMGNNPSKFRASTNPVEQVSWEDTQQFLAKMNVTSENNGMKFELPTEAQWEYACRAATTTAFSFGDNPTMLGEYAWFADNSSSKTHPVGQRRPNPWGLYDMHGNVWEWCADWYGADYYGHSPPVDPTGPAVASTRVNRGSSWYAPSWEHRSAFRSHDPPGTRSRALGFRVMRRPFAGRVVEEKVATEPKEPDQKGMFPKGKWGGNLLTLVNTTQNTLRGNWKYEDGEISTTASFGNYSKLLLPISVQGNYDAQFTFTKEAGQGGVAIIFPVGSRTCMQIIDTNNEKSFLGEINNLGSDTSTTMNGAQLERGKKYTLLLSVRVDPQFFRGSIATELNGKRLANWQGHCSSLRGLSPSWRVEKINSLGLGAQANITFHEVQIRIIDGIAKQLEDK